MEDTETADLGGRAHGVGTVSATVEGGPANVTAAPGGGWSLLERPRQHCFLWAGVASWDGGSCEVLLSLQNPAESSISVKVPPALTVPSDPPQSTCWEKPSPYHQQVGLQHSGSVSGTVTHPQTLQTPREDRVHPSPVYPLPAVPDTPGASGSQGLPPHKCSVGLAVR